jgi:hypothetical protein
MSPTDESILRDKMVPIDRTALYVEDTTILQFHILGKKRGSSSAPSGQSHDHYRDLLQRHPDAIHPLTSFCKLTDGPERMAFVTGKGTVLLLKANIDVRPIVTEEPLWHYVSQWPEPVHAFFKSLPTLSVRCFSPIVRLSLERFIVVMRSMPSTSILNSK